MKQLKVTKQQAQTIETLTRQQECITGRKIPVKKEWHRTILMITAPVAFLTTLGF